MVESLAHSLGGTSRTNSSTNQVFFSSFTQIGQSKLQFNNWFSNFQGPSKHIQFHTRQNIRKNHIFEFWFAYFLLYCWGEVRYFQWLALCFRIIGKNHDSLQVITLTVMNLLFQKVDKNVHYWFLSLLEWEVLAPFWHKYCICFMQNCFYSCKIW